MKTVSITVTDAARNFSDCISRAHYQNTTFVLLKNGAPVARIVPDHARVCAGHDLAEVLREIDLPVKDSEIWFRDLQIARRKLKAPKNKWQ
jgi:antitoxin (DNA-binding transcriptional repressor) of toxin-antitoxin stability system